MLKSYTLPRGKRIKLHQYDPDDTGSIVGKEEIAEQYHKLQEELAEMQDKLFAQKKHSLLVIIQGMDCSGKDGVIKKVFSGINPQGVSVASFKKPTLEEASHDFLWRTHKEVPGRGYIAVFNRSYYEEVLITRVHGQIDEEEAKQRFKQIKHFEKLLISHDTQVVKIFLHISKSFQISKIQKRLSDPSKMWKFDPNDLLERNYWDAYEEAYADVFSHCSFKESPWYIVPANQRWFRDYLVLQIVVDALRKLPLEYPQPDSKLEDLLRLLPDDIRPESV
ncbi:PPK2 family polyphosphate kinase [Paenibacillus rigui]|uniref:Polyphosphate kinase n=1 Tax=Paenibacillus rigui TaxID=554312 RepID=A0A229UG10_9BACL|nr:PPK2 family polyphosphate kinase [Paenibacillus rigui]OXM82323.1 polyphosphate kinase [Paenibacillus rigui]